MQPDLIGIGTTIDDRYRVRRKLGQGGMGSVWLVQHVESLQMLALKTLNTPKEGFERSVLDRFLREARAAAALRSRNVVRIIDAQINYRHPPRNEPLPFIVMELLEGRTLEDLIRSDGKMAPEELVWVLRQVGRALDLAHEKGIVHRDLKPENLFLALDDEGQPLMKVCDFGIAKLGGELAEGMLGTSTEGAFLGTPIYMSPEQAKSATAVVPESDQWALGMIAFKALANRDYFRSTSIPELCMKIAVEPMPPPSMLCSSLSSEFDAWFARSCSREVSGRWRNVKEQVEALAQALGVTTERAPKVDSVAVRIVAERDATPTAPTMDMPSPAPRALLAPGVPAIVSTRPSGHADALTAAAAVSTTSSGSTLATMRRRSTRTARMVGILSLAVFAVASVVLLLSRSEKTSVNSGSASAAASPKGTTSAPSTVVPGDLGIASSAPANSPPVPTPSVPEASAEPSTIPSTNVKAPVKMSGASKGKKPAASPLRKPRGAECALSSECESGICITDECR